MKNIKYLAVILLIFCITFTACGGNNGSANETKKTVETEAPEETQAIYSEFPNVRMDGRVFTVLMPEYFIERYVFNIDEETGEPLNDSAYRRNIEIEEKFDVVIRARGVASSNCYTELSKLVQSGDDSIDLVLPHPSVGAYTSSMTDGHLLNWYDLKYVDFSKPCWNTDMQTALIIAGKSFYANGDMAITGQSLAAFIFNKTMAEDLGVQGDPYKFVLNGTWTVDKLIAFTKDVYIDVNGDGVQDGKDTYGYIADGCEDSLLYSCGVKVAQINSEGKPELCFISERLSTIMDKAYDLLYSEGAYRKYSARTAWGHFTNGGGLVSSWDIGNYWALLRDIEFDIGILPYPKLEEIQDSYPCITTAGLVGVPITVKDPDNASIIIQALMEGSHKYVRPAFIDTVLYNKCLRDEESTQIMEMMLNSFVYDFGFTFDLDRKLSTIITSLVTTKGSTDFASYYEQYKDKVQIGFDNIYEAIIGLE
ncbi:MAG: hypothetical protein FWF15_04375 [Oscillospiraceae bacterium]|nr:hypothetical protein [Oscillospiraceae bacterium]